jgi:molybdate transport system ATP-binding protein
MTQTDRRAAFQPASHGETGLGLSARVRVWVGHFDLEAAVHAAHGEVVALVGPNGAGKTTLLRAVAGLAPIAAGEVCLNGATLEDPAAGVRRMPQQRGVGVVFQDHLLLPHLSAAANVAFGLRAHGARKREAHRLALEWLARVGLAQHAATKPAALSGGQAQRVALARALATEPALLLLDEPTAALDVDARASIQRELRQHLAAFTGPCLLVTHQPLEAIAVADRLVILEGGRVVQAGPTAEVTRRPRSDWAARLVGVNLYRGHARGSQVRLEHGATLVAATEHRGEVFAVIHPRAVSVHAARPCGSPRNVWPGTISALDPGGDAVRVHIDGAVPVVAEITPAALAALRVSEGDGVWASVKATEVDLFCR